MTGQNGQVDPDEDLLAALDWRPAVLDSELFEARLAWLAARDGGELSARRVAVLFNHYRALISLQAQQIADEFRASRRA
jgi:hypothetical protein